MFDEFDQQNALLLKKLKKEKTLTYNEIKDLIGIDETTQEVPHASPLLEAGLIEIWEDLGVVRIDDNDFSGYKITEKGLSYPKEIKKGRRKFWLSILIPSIASLIAVLLTKAIE